MKNRPDSKLMQVLVSSIDDASFFDIDIPPLAHKIAKYFWPGPLTMILEDRNGNTHGLRVPDHSIPLSIINSLKKPLISTSANISGKKPSVNLKDAVADLTLQADIAIDENCPGGLASTVIIVKAGTFSILREGPISEAMISEVL